MSQTSRLISLHVHSTFLQECLRDILNGIDFGCYYYMAFDVDFFVVFIHKFSKYLQ